MKRLLLCACFLLLSVAPALAAPPEAWPELLCPIVAIEPRTANGAYDLRLRCGELDGLRQDSRQGAYISRYVQGAAPRQRQIEVQLSLARVNYLSTEVRLTLPPDADSALPQLGDLISVEIRQDLPSQQRLFQLARLGIVLTSQDGTPWVLYRDYLNQPGFDFEAERLPLMLEEVQAIAPYADQTYGIEPLVDGYFAGKTLREAMAGSQIQDLRDFLAFVEAFPGKYLGYHWKFPEVYATWILNGAPGPDDENVEVIPDQVQPDPDETLGLLEQMIFSGAPAAVRIELFSEESS